MSRVRADRYTDRAGTGSPTFSEGVNVIGISSLGITTVTGVGQTALTVNGDARITGVLTVGQGSVTIGSTNITTEYINDLQYPTNGPLSNRNIIINGGMQVDQRNNGITSTASASAEYCIDRFTIQANVGTGHTTIQSNDAPDGFGHSLRLEVGSGSSPGADDFGRIYYSIEGYDVNCLNLGTAEVEAFTLSFYVKSSLSGTFGGTIKDEGAPSATYTFSYTVSATNTWERHTVTVPAGTFTSGTYGNTTSRGLLISWDLGEGANRSLSTGYSTTAPGGQLGLTGGVKVLETAGATWLLTGVQLERGTRATPFEHRTYSEELLKCQRYFVKIRNLSNGVARTFIMGGFTSTRAFGGIALPTMRIDPTTTFNNMRLEELDLTGSAVMTKFYTYTTQSDGWMIGMEANVASGLVANVPYYVRFSDDTSFVAFDADY
jgi:hypothetical protein